MPSLSVEQIDRKIRDYERQIAELRSLRAGILRYAESVAAKSGSELAKGHVQRFPRLAPHSTGLKAAILGLNLPTSFTVDDVISRLQATGFDFGARSPKEAVRDSLYVLAKKKRGIRRIKQGDESSYEKITP